MTVHVEELISEVVLIDEDFPLSESQLERVAEFVIARIAQKQQDLRQARAATSLRSTSEPPSPDAEAV